MKNVIAILSALATLAGCAKPPPPVPVAAARAAMTGMTPDRVAACMGPAPVANTIRGVTLWSYPSPEDPYGAARSITDPSIAQFDYTQYSADMLGIGPASAGPVIGPGLPQGPIFKSACTVNVVFDRGRVGAVTYLRPDGSLMQEGPACTNLVRRCVP